MKIMKFWDKKVEQKFFTEAMRNFASPAQLFYKLQGDYFAYVPNGMSAERQTLQSRNSLIGQYTEKWCKDFFQPIATRLNLFAVNGVICPELGITQKSNADLAFCKTEDTCQSANNIKLIFEIKMSVVNNYQFKNNKINFIGDYKSHKGIPSILRSDSMLKAIGKSINIRVSGVASKKIPIVILGNAPITNSYIHKVDFLKRAGIIQSFISLYPEPTESNFIKNTDDKGFQTFNDCKVLYTYIKSIIDADMNFMSSMLPKNELGQIIKISAQEKDDILRADKFLELIYERG